ncbi:transposase [Nocardia salmonicida]|uniref:transposase n=1 Tax=Nocardia salmonicida TaxID=53431 RepID=UPI002E2C7A9D|nr:transposase [Nocardia salmonicida]
MLNDVVAEDVSAWRAGFDEVFDQVAGLFGRVEPRRWARAYLTGLLAPVERKNSWQLADDAGVVEPDGFQHFLNRSRWSADELVAEIRRLLAIAVHPARTRTRTHALAASYWRRCHQTRVRQFRYRRQRAQRNEIQLSC